MRKFDIVICVKELDSNLLPLLLRQVKKHIKPQNIIIITKNVNLDSKVIESSIILDENSIYDNLSLDSIKEIISRRGGDVTRAGWYLQQFLKMGYAKFVTKSNNYHNNGGGGNLNLDSNINKKESKMLNSHYLIWDADSIPLRDLEFFSENTTLFEIRGEQHIPYFETLARLNIKFSNNNFLAKQCGGSFIAENMMIDSIKMCELIDMIESSHNTSFFRAIMECVDDRNLSHSGFSEFETYGNFMLIKYPQICKFITRKRERYAKELVGETPSQKQLEWLAKYYDVISIEHFDAESSIAGVTKNFAFARLFSPRSLRRLHKRAKKLHLIKY